ncbi:hypothetical protein D8B26_006146 [Coccidioides posadasii str. Silveira]|uniref:Uncharacterized protein n=2 Tax=Coccidioides posadasii TaxID=199306 RepID=E9DBI3_COCPS|nr:conserved hypothetical protein [Coccidioides posadasii str. Silveira]KMM67660.1 hypothetical protein CPAG_03993 [Coccidioides posadasii RMSCC 3488]QVM11499.1 hypothetical protein D8B26_006146 [Coccidioides posadasii str. Silveira]
MGVITTIIAVGPLASSSAAFMCSAVQQKAVGSFLNTSIPPVARQALYYHWFLGFRNAVYLSAPCHITTLVLCFINLFSGMSNAPSMLWLGGILFTFGHMYPLRLGLEHLGLTEKAWKAKSADEGYAFVKSFVDANVQRLTFVDFPGWLCIVAAVVLGAARSN